jgi:hypothetical protein
MWIVKYVVFGKEFSAGPWNFDEALLQLKDIMGYEHVENARLGKYE